MWPRWAVALVALAAVLLAVCAVYGVVGVFKSGWHRPLPITSVDCCPADAGNHGPIDVVYTWVDSSDPDWIALKDYIVHGRMSDARFPDPRHADSEIRASLEGTLVNAPWVRNVYIVTMRPQAPACLTNGTSDVIEKAVADGRVRIVHHDELGLDAPTFSSHAIESVIHRIPGLSERYLYLNDDVYIVNPVEERHFFAGPYPYLRYSRWWSLDPCIFFNSCKPFNSAWNQVAAMQPWGAMMNDHGVPYALTKSLSVSAEKKEPERWAETRGQAVRTATDIPPLGNALNVGVLEGTVVTAKKDPLVSFFSNEIPWDLSRALKKSHTMCINEAKGVQSITDAIRAHVLRLKTGNASNRARGTRI
jgi:hypothetical protein